MPVLHLATTADGNALLGRDPLALLIGMLLDQQIPMEKAFTSPSVLRDRLGGGADDDLDAAELASMAPDDLAELFRTPPALHRFPGAMAGRVQALCRVLVSEYDGRAAQIWAGVRTGAELHARLAALPGFGEQKARIFLALLGKRFMVQPAGWREAAAPYGEPEVHRSVADVVDARSLQQVRAAKQEAKALARERATAQGASR